MAIDHLARVALSFAFAATLAVYPLLGPEMPPFAAFALPLVATAIWWLLASLNQHAAPASRRADRAGALTAVFLSAFHLTMLAAFIGEHFWLGRILGLIVGLFLIVTGNELPRVRPNVVWGIRTPQTLASEDVWRRVHRLAGYLRVVMGSVVSVASLTGASGFAQLIPIALCLETAVCFGAGMVFSRRKGRFALHGVQ